MLVMLDCSVMLDLGVQRIEDDPYGPVPTVLHTCDSRINW